MVAFVWILLLAASTSVQLVDEVYQIPRAEWRYVELGLRQQPAFVSAGFDVESGSRQVRLALMTSDDLDHLRHDLPHGVMAVTAAGNAGQLVYRVRRPGDYVIVVDNRADGSQPAAVHLRISLNFAGASEPEVTQISPRRQLVVIVISFAVFFGIVTFSARRLLRAIRR